jgi:hypothetical protein
MRRTLLTLLLAATCPLLVSGWGEQGHTIVGQAAAKTLPQDMPMFFRAADDQLAYLNAEPDRWRDAREQTFGTWLNATSKEHYVFLDLVPPEALQASDRYAYLDILAKRGIVSPVVRVGGSSGLLYFRVLELAQEVRVGFRALRETKDSPKRSWIQARIIDDAGILGHYVADGANPHHTSVHMFGWLGNNESYVTDAAFHSRFETDYVQSHVQLRDVLEKVPRQPRIIRDLQADVLQYLKRSNSLVEQLYQLDREERFGLSTTGTAQKAFTVARLADAATLLRDLWWTAWITSGEAPPRP